MFYNDVRSYLGGQTANLVADFFSSIYSNNKIDINAGNAV